MTDDLNINDDKILYMLFSLNINNDKLLYQHVVELCNRCHLLDEICIVYADISCLKRVVFIL